MLYERLLPFLNDKPLAATVADFLKGSSLPELGAPGWTRKLRSTDPTHSKCALEVTPRHGCLACPFHHLFRNLFSNSCPWGLDRLSKEGSHQLLIAPGLVAVAGCGRRSEADGDV